MKIFKRISILLAGMLILTACAQSSAKVIRFADVGWDTILFHNAVAGKIAEVVFGYEWEEVSGTTPITHEAVKKGEIDVHMETWTDNLPNYAGDLEVGLLTELGVNFDDNEQGFYVPRYVIEGDIERGIAAVAPNLKTVADLKDYAHLFKDSEDPKKGLIYGGIAGWEITQIMKNKYIHYGLDAMYNYIEPGTDAATSAVLVSAYDRGEPVVAYYWSPTWLLGMYDFVLLEDAPYDEAVYFNGECECPSVKVTICVSNEFYKDNPEFSAFLSKYNSTSNLINKALAHIQETGDDYNETAEWFIKEYREIVETWLTSEQVKVLYDNI